MSTFTGDDCSAPEEKSASIGFWGVVKGKLRKEKGGFDEGVDGGKICDPDGPTDCAEVFGGESRKLAEPGDYSVIVNLHFPVRGKSCTYAFDLPNLPCSDCYLWRPLETGSLYLLGRGLLAIASP